MKLKFKSMFLLSALGILTLFVGCTKDKVHKGPDVPIIELSEDRIDFSKSCMEVTYQFKIYGYTDEMPTVVANADWVIVSDLVMLESGDNFQTFQCTVTAVFMGLEHFVSELYILYKNAEQKLVNVVQNNTAQPVICPVNSDDIHFTLEGGEVDYKLSILPYRDWDIAVTTSADWLSIKDASCYDATDYQAYDFVVSATPSTESRKAEIIVTYGKIVHKIIVEQNNSTRPIISLSRDRIKASQSGQKFSLQITISNYTGGMPKIYNAYWYSDDELLNVDFINECLGTGEMVEGESKLNTHTFTIDFNMPKSDPINKIRLLICYKNAQLKPFDILQEGFG